MAAPEPTWQPPGGAGAWRILAATERGAAHHARGLPNQDAVAHAVIEPGGAVVAVADGHGHSRHFRSERGAKLAVSVACRAARERAHWPAPGLPAGEAAGALRGGLVPAIVAHWREAVAADLAAEPFRPAEERLRWPGDAPLVAYGTTLLLAAVSGDWLLLAQIGDGDIVGICAGGAPLLAVPGDPLLDGHLTTSLCSLSAEGSFRVAAVGLPARDLLGVFLATDGYANAQADEDWEHAVSADLAALIGAHPPGWLAGQLPGWARRCASAEGSADDTTIALLLAPRLARAAPQAEAGAR